MTEKESMLEEWLQNHPAPSWKLVAWAIYRRNKGQLTEHSVLKQLYGKHVSGMWLCTDHDNKWDNTTLIASSNDECNDFDPFLMKYQTC